MGTEIIVSAPKKREKILRGVAESVGEKTRGKGERKSEEGREKQWG